MIVFDLQTTPPTRRRKHMYARKLAKIKYLLFFAPVKKNITHDAGLEKDRGHNYSSNLELSP